MPHSSHNCTRQADRRSCCFLSVSALYLSFSWLDTWRQPNSGLGDVEQQQKKSRRRWKISREICQSEGKERRRKERGEKQSADAGALVSTLTEAKADWTLLLALGLIFNQETREFLLLPRASIHNTQRKETKATKNIKNTPTVCERRKKSAGLSSLFFFFFSSNFGFSIVQIKGRVCCSTRAPSTKQKLKC